MIFTLSTDKIHEGDQINGNNITKGNEIINQVNTEILDRSKNNVGTINKSNKRAMVFFNFMYNLVFISYLHRLSRYVYMSNLF